MTEQQDDSLKDLRDNLAKALVEVPINEKLAFDCYIRIIKLLESSQQRDTNDLSSTYRQDLAELLLETQFLTLQDCIPHLPPALKKTCSTLEEYGMAILDQLIADDPENGAKKYFLKAQALRSAESLPLFIKAKQIAERELENQQPTLNLQIINILLAVSDLYLSVLCDEPEAQDSIETCLQQAAELDPNHFSVLAQRAIYYKIITDEDRAIVDARAAAQAFQRYIENPNLDDIPDTDAIMIFASLCTELNLHQQASQLLDFLLLRDDTRDDVWYRMALAKFAAADFDASLEAIICCEQIIALYGDGGAPDEVVQGISELRARIESVQSAHPANKISQQT